MKKLILVVALIAFGSGMAAAVAGEFGPGQNIPIQPSLSDRIAQSFFPGLRSYGDEGYTRSFDGSVARAYAFEPEINKREANLSNRYDNRFQAFDKARPPVGNVFRFSF